MRYNISVPINLSSPFSYSYENEELLPGQLVAVNFRNRENIGVVTGESDDTDYSGKIKNISSVLPYALPEIYIKFVDFVSRYTINSYGNILKLLLPFSIDQLLAPEKTIKSIDPGKNKSDIQLSDDQLLALEQLKKSANSFKVFLIHGVTGSGKTEVFLEFAKNKKQVLIMVPEIALSNELAKKVASRMDGKEVYIWHHSISPAKKRDIWKKSVNGENIVIVGARSSLFIPFKDLECIIIDEEHDSSFKQSEGSIYNGRDMGIYLGSLLNIPVILSSATPSLETYNNAISKRYEYIRLKSRYHEGATVPDIYIDDLRKHKTNELLSMHSKESIQKCLDNKNQAIVFVNRRGHTPRILCSSCGWKVMCNSCDAWLCYHSNDNSLVCHHCGFKKKMISKCGECGNDSLIGIGTGVDKASAEISKLFPQARVMSLSSDNMNTPNKISKALKAIHDNDVDIIVGTQILAKGHNFMNLNTIIITCVDAMLYGDDFRSSERAFQVLHQIAGRAGRSHESSGSAVIFQTFNPDDKLVQLLASDDIDKFYEIEIHNRRMMHMPPFGKMISVTISSVNQKNLEAFSVMLIRKAVKTSDIKILGPMVPGIPRVRNMYRLRFVIQSRQLAQNYVKSWLASIKIPVDIKISVDVDPGDFM